MNILLVYPPLNEYTSYWNLHLGLGYISAVLSIAGHDVTVLDCVVEKMGFDKFRSFLNGQKFDIVGITSTTSEIKNAYEVAKIVKENNENTFTILGGPHCTALPEETLNEFPKFDIIVLREGEKAIVEILDCIKEGGRLEKVKGIGIRKNGMALITEPRPPIMDLDSLPFPEWKKFKIEKYKGYLGLRKKIEISVSSGRGCPNQCVFCQRFLGRGIRMRDPKRVVDEMEYDIGLGAKSINFCDETFTLFKKRTMEICDEMIKRGINKEIEWHCETRVDDVDFETLKKMKEAGCVMVNYGVESGNNTILKNSKKGITVKQVVDAFEWSKKIGLRTYMNLIFGHPGETVETINDSINLMMKINPDFVTIGIMVPFPGTEILEMAKRGDHGLKILGGEWDSYSKQDCSVLSVNNLTNADLKRWHSRAYSKFYLRPSRIFNLFEFVNLRGMLRMVLSRVRSGEY